MLWDLIYHSEPGRSSPREYINGLTPSEQVHIDLKLDVLRSTERQDWPKWVSPLEDKILELRQGDHRILFFTHKRTMVVVHALRKKERRIRERDKDLAKRRRDDFLARS